MNPAALAWILGYVLACGSPQGPQSSSPAADAAETAQDRRHFARNFWYEIATDRHPGKSWMIPQCEPAGERSGLEFKPSQPAADSYGPAAPRARSPLAVALAGAVARAARARGRAVPQADSRLDMAAEELARLVPRSGRLPVRLVEFVVRQRGVVAPAPLVLVLWGPIFDVDAMVAQLEPELPDVLDSSPWNRLGIGSVERDDLGAGVVVLAFQLSHVQLKTVPRAVSGDGSIRIAGTVSPSYRTPRVSVVHGLGDRGQPRQHDQGEREFDVVVDCGGHKGSKHIEIEARRGHATELLARFPLWCDSKPPSSIVVDVENPERARAAVSSGDATVYIAALVNSERERCGLTPLRVDPRLSEISRGHTDDLSTAGTLSHDSPAGQSPEDRARMALGMVTEIYRYVARSYELYEVQRELLNSFDYRATILSPGITHMGLAVETRGAGSHPELFMTQLFAGVPDAVDMSQVRAVVEARLREERSLTADSELMRAARRAADALAGGAQVEDIIDRTVLELRRRKTEFLESRLHVWSGADVADFQPGGVLLASEYRYFGIGVSRTAPAPGREAAFHIVVVVANKPGG